jgi:hypothetical protein
MGSEVRRGAVRPLAKCGGGVRTKWLRQFGLRGVAAAALLLALSACSREPAGPRVDFNRDIRPLLTKNCTGCHGGVRKLGGISFVFREEAFAKGASGRSAIVPGNIRASELIARLESDDPEFRMPHHAPPLQAGEIALFRRWIAQGAKWDEHWAFVPPKPQPLPAAQGDWARQPVDRFVLARLQREGLQPAGEERKAELLRRVSFDLTGLPPTDDQLQAFLADDAANAYERQVDRLLASPHFGERWASLWMDLARYADSRGFEKDLNRPGVWVYRDWVVDAYNRNLPYDQFVIRQLAGDLLPGATLQDRIATAFNRLTPANDEGGTDDEEYRMVAVMDRATTAWGALNGFTMGCVQCHAHPYDPVQHEDYFRFLAFFNTSRDADLPNDAPFMPVPTDPAQYPQADALWKRLQAARGELIDASRALVQAGDAGWRAAPVRAARSDVDAAIAQEIDAIARNPGWGPTPAGKAAIAELELARAAASKDASLIKPSFEIRNGEAYTVGIGRNVTVYDYVVDAQPGALTALRLDLRPLDPDTSRTMPEDGFIVNHVKVFVQRADGSETAVPMAAWLPDAHKALDYRLLDLIKRGVRADLYSVNDLYRRPITAADGAQALLAVDGVDANSKLVTPRWMVGVPQAPLALQQGQRLRIRVEQLTGQERNSTVRRLAVSTSSAPRWSRAPQALTASANDVVRAYNSLAALDTVPLPIMAEQADFERRQTRLFERGNMLTRVGAAMPAAMPQLFPQAARDAPVDRLAMARAFFAPDQPLTARVAVNRYWEQLFGLGLVETLEDFGSAGLPPSHPELLDWLALHFQNDLKWDSKALLRELVLSATYRQDARADKALVARDPRNRLLARGPRQRLTAEMVRDQALAASGLLTATLGGPPVMPPQPDGVWKVVYSSDKWIEATGANRYRRALYTFIKRSATYPSFLTFDAPAHEVSVARRIPTNTPLQALVTQNDPVQTEAWAALARRVLEAPAATLPGLAQGDATSGTYADAQADASERARRLNYAGRLVLSRDLSPGELADVDAYYRDNLAGATPTRAMTAVAGLLFNLDAALNR